MPISPDDLARLRPWAFHTTTPANFAAIRRWRRLRSVADLLKGTPHLHLLRSRRLATHRLTVDDVPIEIRDQQPLQRGHIQFQVNFTFEDLLAELNDRVFFWPGGAGGPGKRGRAHYRRYESLGPAVVRRCSIHDLLALNGIERAYVASSNSGAPRSNPRTGYAVRGPSTFRLLTDASFTPGRVQELSFRGHAQLPAATEWSEGFEGSWQPLWPAN